MPDIQFGWDRKPLGPVVEPPDDRLDGATLKLVRTRLAQPDRGNRGFEVGLLGIGQNLHLLSP